MDRIENYRKCVTELLNIYAKHKNAKGEIDSEVIIDKENDHYQLLRIGWIDDERVFGCMFHFDIKDGKIWIQHNASDIQIAKELETLGVSKLDIVLGFQPPYKRKYSGYGEA